MKNNRVKIKIQQIYAGLRPSEQKVADYILEYEGKASKLLMETLAQETGVSQPTVIRFVKRLDTRVLRTLSMPLYRKKQRNSLKTVIKSACMVFNCRKKTGWRMFRER